MQPLNPFLGAFSKSPFLAQSSPAQLHILLVPSTDVLLDSRDQETGAPLSASIASDEFLGSHVLRVPAPKKKEIAEGDLVNITDLPEWTHKAFGTESSRLNPIQSKAYPIAFGTDEPILLCAPTGAGKVSPTRDRPYFGLLDC